MKYSWEDMNAKQKWAAFEREATLETHNGTTKEDFVNIVKFLYECMKMAEEAE